MNDLTPAQRKLLDFSDKFFGELATKKEAAYLPLAICRRYVERPMWRARASASRVFLTSSSSRTDTGAAMAALPPKRPCNTSASASRTGVSRYATGKAEDFSAHYLDILLHYQLV